MAVGKSYALTAEQIAAIDRKAVKYSVKINYVLIKLKIMKTLNQILHPLKKFSKGILGLLMLNLLIVSVIFIFESCQKIGKTDDGAKDKFLSALKLNTGSIGSVPFINGNNMKSASFDGSVAIQPVYLKFPSQVTTETSVMFQNTNTIQDLSHLIQYTGAVLEYEPTPINVDYQINVPIHSVEFSLQPMVTEAKQYLYTKGFTEWEIQDMIATEGGTEYDLIGLVMVISDTENNPSFASNYPNLFLFMNTAYAGSFAECAWRALGFTGGAAAYNNMVGWTKAAIKSAFKAIARQVLGPIGIAVALVTFVWCMW